MSCTDGSACAAKQAPLLLPRTHTHPQPPTPQHTPPTQPAGPTRLWCCSQRGARARRAPPSWPPSTASARPCACSPRGGARARARRTWPCSRSTARPWSSRWGFLHCMLVWSQRVRGLGQNQVRGVACGLWLSMREAYGPMAVHVCEAMLHTWLWPRIQCLGGCVCGCIYNACNECLCETCVCLALQAFSRCAA